MRLIHRGLPRGVLRSGASSVGPVLTRPPTLQRRFNATVSEESLARYHYGGYHPVRIGDRFKSGRYEVVNKLGYGLYSTVWLVRDAQ
jgi:hypothetical protein